MKYYLYKYFVKDALVYIGKTTSPYKRLVGHMQCDNKYRQVTAIEVCECENKASMDILELMLIVSLKPPWNVAGATDDLLQFPLPEMTFTRYSVGALKSKYQSASPSKRTHKKVERKRGNRKAFTLSLDRTLIDHLDKYCEKERRTRSSAIEIAIEEYIEYVKSLRRTING